MLARLLGGSLAPTFTSPPWGALLAVHFLGERLTMARALAVTAAFVGVLIILRPGVVQVSLGALSSWPVRVPCLDGANKDPNAP